MKFLVVALLGWAAALGPAAADVGNYSDFIMYGPHGEIADQDTPYILVEDDDGVLQKGYITPMNVSLASPVDSLPQLVRFYLWTKHTPSSEGERLFVGNNEVLQASTFNHSNPTKFIIHGFGNTIKSKAILEPKSAYLTRGEYNVIGVDWGDMCGAPWYSTAKANTMYVGGYVGEMIKFLVEMGGASPDDIHIIGHSLGAHVSGIAGSSLGEDHKVSRVTGLDPAGPLFYSAPPEERIDPTDAKFVDAIHTCGGYSLPSLGLMEPTAMADFYPNGGVNVQPSCESLISVMGIPCSHSYAYILWRETVLRHDRKFGVHGPLASLEELPGLGLGGEEASGIGSMGEDAPHTMRGIYWLSTR